MSSELALAAGLIAALDLAPLAAPWLAAQQFRDRDRVTAASHVTSVYDRVTDSTRVTASLGGSPIFGLGSRVWLDASFVYPGRELVWPPDVIVLSLDSFTPSKGGWAFAHPQTLRVKYGKTLLLEVPTAQYLKRPVGLFDAGRREVLSFRIPLAELASMAEQPELALKVGNASLRLKEHRMEVLRTFLRMIPVGQETR
jgi:hypothetical protein